MFERLHTLNKATTLAAVLSMLTMVPAQAQQTVTPEEPAGDAGFFSISGTTVKKKLARTHTLASTFTKSVAPQTWKRLNLATLAHTVPAGTTDLFNVTFTAECRVNNASANDYMRIRVVDLNTGIPLEPYDGDQSFCSAVADHATFTGTWAKRLGPGVHTIQVEFWAIDALPLNPFLSGTIDDWTFEVVIYQ
jgi:hypothetical protein